MQSFDSSDSSDPLPTNLTTRTRFVVILLALTVGLAAVGCGDDSETNPGADTGVDASPGFDLRLPSLSAPVTVQFDEWGIPHVQCETNLDCFRAQGYLHADDRFFQMDFIRRSTFGELSGLLGPLALDLDRPNRRLMTTRQGEPLEDAYLAELDEETTAMLEAYSTGVNAWLDDARNSDNGATLTREYDHPLIQSDDTRDWRPQDSIALYLQLAMQLGESSGGDLARASNIAALGEETALDLYTVKPGVESNILDVAGNSAMSGTLDGDESRPTGLSSEQMGSIIDRLSEHRDVIDEAAEQMDDVGLKGLGVGNNTLGSNSWAVGANQTEDGVGLFANDPHLTLNNPAIWYGMELESNEGLHVIGGSIPAAPGVVFGHNEDVAWGATTARFDLADAYREEVTSDGEAVMRDGQRVELIEREYTFDLPAGNSETATFEWVPDHGPLISKNADENTGVSIKWTAHNAGPDLEFILDLMQAESVDEAMTAVEPAGAINQSWTFMDDEGNIGWNPMGSVPDREPWVDADTPNWLPLPGDGSAEWQGTLSPDDLPEMYNPAAGYLATANNDMDGSYTDGDSTDDGHTPWQHPPALGYRHMRIIDQLEENAGSHTVDTMHELQADTYSQHAATILPRILQIANSNSDDLSSDAQTVVDTLSDWDYTCPSGLDGLDPEDANPSGDADQVDEAAGCAAFHAMLPRLTEGIFGDELAPTGIDTAANWDSYQAPLIYVLTDPDELSGGESYFDDIDTEGTTETAGDIIPSVLDETASELNSQFESTDPADWLWGRIHTVTLESFFARAGVTTFNYGPFASDGGFYTVDVANPNARGANAASQYAHNVGASVRLVVRGSQEDGMEGWFQLPGGQDNHEDSQWYNSLLDEWLEDTRLPLLYEESELEGRIAEQWRFGPEQTAEE